MPGESKVQHTATAYRVSGLSFCPLEDTVIVLDPNQGLYFQLSKRLASFLQSLPEHAVKIPPTVTEERVFSSKEHTLLIALANSKLLTPDSKLGDEGLLGRTLDTHPHLDAAAFASQGGQVPEIAVWGTLSELTQPPPPPSGGTSTGPPL